MAAGAQLWCSDSQPGVPHGSQGGANWTGQPLTDPSILAEHLHLQPARTAGDLPQHCDMCGGLHFLRRTDRPMSAARQCDECGTRHPVRQNEVWFESASAGGWAVGWWDGTGGMHVLVRSLSTLLHLPQLVACLFLLSALLDCCALCLMPCPALLLPLHPAPGFMRRTIHMYCCYKGVVYDMRCVNVCSCTARMHTCSGPHAATTAEARQAACALTAGGCTCIEESFDKPVSSPFQTISA